MTARILEHPPVHRDRRVLLALIAVPLGMIIGHTGRGTFLVVTGVNALRALPTLGVLLLGVLLRVETPNAMPLIVGGLRTATLQIVATATVAAAVPRRRGRTGIEFCSRFGAQFPFPFRSPPRTRGPFAYGGGVSEADRSDAKDSAFPAILTWRAHDVPRMESVRVQLSGDRVKAYGRIVAAATPSHPAFSASYDLVTDESGATKRLSLTVTLAERERQLSIARDEENMWLVQDHSGQTSRSAFDGALDVDVIFSPFFNALPIRRTGVYRADAIRSTMPVVYVRVPDLSVELATISYSYGADGIKLHSPVAETTITVDSDGFILDYPGLADADLITPPARPAAASSSRQLLSADDDGDDLGPAETVVADPGGMTGLDEFGHRLVGGQSLSGVVEQVAAPASSTGSSCVGVGLAHRPHQVGCGRRDAGAVAERSGRQRERQRDLTGGDGERLGQQVRKMRDGRGGGVVLVGAGGDDDGAAVQRQVHHLGPHAGVDVVVDADHPGCADEQPGVAGRPTRMRGACHRMPADEPLEQAVRLRPREHGTFDAGHIGQRAARARRRGCGRASSAARARARRARSARSLPAARVSASSRFVGGVESVESWPPRRRRSSGCSRKPRARPPSAARITEPPISPRPTTHTGVFVTRPRLAHRSYRPSRAGADCWSRPDVGDYR